MIDASGPCARCAGAPLSLELVQGERMGADCREGRGLGQDLVKNCLCGCKHSSFLLFPDSTPAVLQQKKDDTGCRS